MKLVVYAIQLVVAVVIAGAVLLVLAAELGVKRLRERRAQ